MSIATSLQSSVDKARELFKRDNGDLENFLPNILKDIEFDIERVSGLEQVAPISEELVNEFKAREAGNEQRA